MLSFHNVFEVLKAIAVRIVFNMVIDRVWRRRTERSELSRLAASASRE